MPLLKNGSPFRLEGKLLTNYAQKMIWQLPPVKWDAENNRPDLPDGRAIPNKYLMKEGDNMVEIRYYTEKRWDDGLKRDFYLVENTGESIMFDNKGAIITSNAELNYFLHNCPYNGTNPFRVDAHGNETLPHENPYLQTSVLFMQYKPQDSHRVASAKVRAISRLQSLIDIEGDNVWSKEDIVNACQLILSNVNTPIVTAIANYKEYLNEEDVITLRNAIMEMIMRDPLLMENLLLDRREMHILTMLNDCLKFQEVSGLSYNETERKYVVRKKDGNIEEFLKIDPRKNPEQYILTECKNNSKMFKKLWTLWDTTNKQIASQK